MKIHYLRINEKKEDENTWSTLLEESGIKKDRNVDVVVGVFDGQECIATGSVLDNIIKCIAVKEDYKGGAVASTLITHLEAVIYETFDSCFVYTKPENMKSFNFLGYKELVTVDDQVVFMEKALNDLEVYLDNIYQEVKVNFSVAAIVMNANPFTYGHQFLAEKASEENERVYIFVVSEDKSFVPFADRIKLVKSGTSHLKNVIVLETGPYMVSQATFPSYFLPNEKDKVNIQAMLDAKLFKEKIAPKLGISKRYVGEEPFSQTTLIYNQEMKRVFKGDLTLVELKRLSKCGREISASCVRKLWRENRFDEIKHLVPETTYKYILSH